MALEFTTVKMREVVIKPAAHGFIVRCGCCEAAFSTKEEVISAIAEYLNDPEGVERRYNDTCQTMHLPDEAPRPDRPEITGSDTEQMNQELRRRTRPYPTTGAYPTDAEQYRSEDDGGNCAR